MKALPLFVIACCVATINGPLQAQVELQYRFNQGETIEYQLDQLTRSESKVLKRSIVNDVRQSYWLQWEVLAVDDAGAATIRQTINRIRQETDLPAPISQLFRFDSDIPKPMDDELSQTLADGLQRQVGQQLAFVMTAQGELTNLVLPDPDPDLPPEVANRDALVSSGLANMLTNVIVRFPVEPISPGSQWTSTSEVQRPQGTVKTTVDYTYEGTGEIAFEQIKSSTDVVFLPDPQAKTPLMIKTTAGPGEAQFDRQSGRLVETKRNLTQKTTTQVGTDPSVTTSQTELKLRLILRTATPPEPATDPVDDLAPAIE